VNCETPSKYWLYFAAIVFAIMSAAAFTMLTAAVILYNTGFLSGFEGTSISPILIMLILSILIGTTISIFVGRKILDPIAQFSNASMEVAKGNFDVKLPENQRIKEIRDVSHNFNLMVQELGSIETLRKDFMVNVSHEFKTPIAAIEGYAMLLQDKDLSEVEHDEYIKMIIDSSRRLSALSRNILKLSKLENQEMVVDKTVYSLDEQLRQALLTLEPEWTKKEIELEIDLPKVKFLGNKDLLMQVWINLLDNAIKFSREHGTIGVRLSEEKSRIIIEISDSGIGMTENIKNHIFEKFYQGNSARSSGGNGLGLSLVKRIIDLCSGEINVISEPQMGSTFIVALPKDYSLNDRLY
jgi:signal transduction histidine kinase